MDWLKSVLPTLATALGGPLAGMAVNFFADKLGISEKTVDAVKAAIAGATPEQMVQMKQIDADLQKHFADLGVDLERIAAADRASARDREIKTGDVWTPRILAIVITVGFFTVLGFLLKYGKPEVGGDALLILLGALGAAWTSVISYYYGTSASSQQKNDILAKK